MAQPFPPQGNQTQHTERPLKVYAEQMKAGAPIPVGVITTGPNGVAVPPHLIAGGVYWPVREGEWVISNRYTGQPIEVISNEEYAERFGGPPAEG